MTTAAVTHRSVRARGLDFHLAEAGEGDDVVLCLHGWPQHWYEWRHLMPALADRHRVLALDLRGFGWSDAPRDGYEKEELATDVLAVLDALGLERVKLVGHDWGAWIGFLLCLREPRRFERYLALNILPPWTSARAMAPHLWRFWYQWVILSPGLGYRAAPQRPVRPEGPGRRLDRQRGLGRARRCAPSPTTSPSPRGPGRRCRCTGSSTCARRRRSCAAATPRSD